MSSINRTKPSIRSFIHCYGTRFFCSIVPLKFNKTRDIIEDKRLWIGLGRHPGYEVSNYIDEMKCTAESSEWMPDEIQDFIKGKSSAEVGKRHIGKHNKGLVFKF